MPRILQLSSRLPFPLDDGGRIATWNLSRCLRHNGYDIDLVCYAGDPAAPEQHAASLAEAFATVSTVGREMERQYPVDLLRAILTGSSYFVRKFHTRDYARLVREHLAASRYEVTLIDGAFMGVFLPLARRAASAAGKVVLRAHNVEYEILERLAQNERSLGIRTLLRREGRLFRRFELDLLTQVDQVYTITDRDAATFARAGVTRELAALAPFIDVDRYQRDPALPCERHSIVHVGNMAWMPNINGIRWFVDRVWPRVTEAWPETKLYLVGKNPPSEIRQWADDRIIITGYVEDEKPFMQKAHLFIVPLLEGSGVRIKILTAMTLGVPILSTTIGAEGIDWPGLMIEDEPDRWADTVIEHFKTEPEPSTAAMAHVRERYDWRRTLRL